MDENVEQWIEEHVSNSRNYRAEDVKDFIRKAWSMGRAEQASTTIERMRAEFPASRG
jgi:hypothetical protein